MSERDKSSFDAAVREQTRMEAPKPSTEGVTWEPHPDGWVSLSLAPTLVLFVFPWGDGRFSWRIEGVQHDPSKPLQGIARADVLPEDADAAKRDAVLRARDLIAEAARVLDTDDPKPSLEPVSDAPEHWKPLPDEPDANDILTAIEQSRSFRATLFLYERERFAALINGLVRRRLQEAEARIRELEGGGRE